MTLYIIFPIHMNFLKKSFIENKEKMDCFMLPEFFWKEIHFLYCTGMFYLIRFSIFIICYLLIFLISVFIKIGLNIETSLGLIYILPDLFLFDILIKFMIKKGKIISLWWFVCFEYIMSCSGIFLSQDGIFQCFVDCSKKNLLSPAIVAAFGKC